MKDPAGVFSRLFFLAFFVCLVWSFLFAGFVNGLQNQAQTKKIAEGLVVLTGGSGRIDEGFELLSKGRGQRLLISGVNQTLDFETIMRDIGQDQVLKDCCVDAENLSTNTVSNAREAIVWAKEHGYKSLILVTSDYHMPRTLEIFKGVAGDIEIIPHPVKSEISPFGLALEYNKYLLSLAGL